MSSDVDDGFEVPSVPAPFKGLEKDWIETRKRQALFLRQALLIVERFARNPVSVTMLACALPWLEREQYDDIAVERNAYGNCGYALCCNPKGQTSKQKYRICTRSHRVYDITERRPFCSDWCFRASRHIRKQISKEPAWCRSVDSLKSCNIDLLPRNVSGHVGKVILDVPNRLLLTGSESDSSVENESDMLDELNSSKLSNSTIECTRLGLEKLQLEMNAKNNLQIGDIHQRTIGPIESKAVCENNQTETSITSFDSKQVLVDHNNSSNDSNSNASTVPTPLSDRISRRLCEWLTEKALDILTTYSFTTEQSTLTSEVHNRVLQQFYSKYNLSKKKNRENNNPVSEVPLTCVLPLIDSVSPQVLRRQILLDDLKHSMHRILSVLRVNPYCAYRRLENSVLHFNLTCKNVHLNPSESQLMALVLLRLMANVEPTLSELTNNECVAHFLKSMHGPPPIIFINKIINRVLRLYNVESDDDSPSED